MVDLKGEWSTIFHVYKAPTLHLFGIECARYIHIITEIMVVGW